MSGKSLNFFFIFAEIYIRLDKENIRGFFQYVWNGAGSLQLGK